MFVFIFTAVTLISPTVHGFLPVTVHEYPLMHYTKLISEEHFTAERPLVVVLPLAEEDATNKEVGYLIEELHTSGRWPILVYNTSYKMNENMYTEISQHGSYVLLISGPCNEWEIYISGVGQQLFEMAVNDTLWHSWNPRGNYIVSVMSNCTHMERSNISRDILNQLWFYQVSNAAVLFLQSNKHTGNDLQQNTNHSSQGTYLEMHTWYPYENSDRCNPAEGNVPVKVFTVRNLSDIRSRDIFRGHYVKNLHGCTLNVLVDIKPLSEIPPELIWFNNSEYNNVYEDPIEIKLIRIIANSLNMSLDFEDTTEIEQRNVTPVIYASRFAISSGQDYLTERTYDYLTVRLDWYRLCAVRNQRWSRFFNIFSVDMWICFALSLVLAVITVSCISIYGHKSHLQESNTYRNIFGATANIIAVVLSVSVSTQPRSAPLRLFFFCWVCYSVAVSTVFQAYLTTFLVEPGYDESIKTLKQILTSDIKFGFTDENEVFLNNVPDSIDLAILKNALRCLVFGATFTSAAAYENMSFAFDNWSMEICRDIGKMTDENKRPLLCKVENGDAGSVDLCLLVVKGCPLLELINCIIQRVVESGILINLVIQNLRIEKILLMSDVTEFDDTYTVFGIRHLQTAFYLLMVGHVLAFASFMIEIMWHRYMSKV